MGTREKGGRAKIEEEGREEIYEALVKDRIELVQIRSDRSWVASVTAMVNGWAVVSAESCRG